MSPFFLFFLFFSPLPSAKAFNWNIAPPRRLDNFSDRHEAACANLPEVESSDGKVVSAANRSLQTFEQWREGKYTETFDKIFSGNFTSETYQGYIVGLSPFLIPLILGLILMPVILIFACIMIFPSCRVLCCKASRDPRPFSGRRVFCSVIFFATFAAILVVCAILSQHFMGNFSTGVKQSNCYIHKFIDGSVNGAKTENAEFVGIHGAREILLETLLDMDGTNPDSLVSHVNESLDASNSIENSLVALEDKVDGLSDLLENNLEVQYHDCVFCDMALNNPGLLASSFSDVFDTAATALKDFRDVIKSKFGADKIASINEHLLKAKEILSDSTDWVSGPLNTISKSIVYYHDQMDDLRHALFTTFSAIGVIICALGGLVYVHIFMSRKPTPLVSGCVSFLAILYASAALVIGGLLFFVAVPVSDSCNYSQTQLFGGGNWTSVQGDAKVIMEQCLTKGGDGDMFSAFNLTKLDVIQKEVNDAFSSLRLDVPVDITRLETFEVLGRSLGDMFVGRPSAMGMTFDAADYSLIEGSNIEFGRSSDPRDGGFSIGVKESQAGVFPSYEDLIYPYYFPSFVNTSLPAVDPLFAITPEQPAVIPPGSSDFRKAIEFAKIKSRFFEEDVLRCDSNAQDVFRTCSVSDFASNINKRTSGLVESAIGVENATQTASAVLIDELWPVLNSSLTNFIEIPPQLDCRFVYESFSSIIHPLCEVGIHNLTLVAVCWIAMGILSFIVFIILYKVFRALSDYRRSEKKWGKSQIHQDGVAVPPYSAPYGGAHPVQYSGAQMMQYSGAQMMNNEISPAVPNGMVYY